MALVPTLNLEQLRRLLEGEFTCGYVPLYAGPVRLQAADATALYNTLSSRELLRDIVACDAATSDKSDSLLTLAVNSGIIDAIEALVDAGAHPVRSSGPFTASQTFLAVFRAQCADFTEGNAITVLRLLYRANDCVLPRGFAELLPDEGDGSHPLLRAIERGWEQCMQALMDMDRDAARDVHRLWCGMTLLHKAAQCKQPGIINSLLMQGWSPLTLDATECTPAARLLRHSRADLLTTHSVPPAAAYRMLRSLTSLLQHPEHDASVLLRGLQLVTPRSAMTFPDDVTAVVTMYICAALRWHPKLIAVACLNTLTSSLALRFVYVGTQEALVAARVRAVRMDVTLRPCGRDVYVPDPLRAALGSHCPRVCACAGVRLAVAIDSAATAAAAGLAHCSPPPPQSGVSATLVAWAFARRRHALRNRRWLLQLLFEVRTPVRQV